MYVAISDNGIGITPQQQCKKQCFDLIGIAERALRGGPAGIGCRLPPDTEIAMG
ncbi:hypothetical protein [Janthinobacterium sp. LB3P112]|uniref:hypothetical protein n=1 Tax=Janthinobacterium sp. LB3P112 TaxID=3424196 RepID=UPI003F247AF7